MITGQSETVVLVLLPSVICIILLDDASVRKHVLAYACTYIINTDP